MEIVKQLFKFILQVALILWLLVALKRMHRFRWLYFFFLWLSVLISSLFPAVFIHVIFAGPNSLGNILTLPWTFYILYIPFVIFLFNVFDSIVNAVLKSIGDIQKTQNSFRDLLIGLLLIVILGLFASGGINKMKARDEIYRRNVNGEIFGR